MALGLMALLVLLLMTLSALLMVESTATNNAKNLALAKQNALAGAYQALGVLQQTAGADTRVTARADIVGEDAANPYWTGVWDSGNGTVSTQATYWLVSQKPTASISPATVLSDSESVVLIPTRKEATGTLAGQVRVPRMSIDSADRLGGGYAWWIADEGVKASLGYNATPDGGEDLAKDPNMTPAQRKRNLQLAPARTALEVLALAQDDTYTLSPAQQHLAGLMTDPKQLKFLGDGIFFDGQDETFKHNRYFHDLTAQSYGVLAKTTTVSGAETLKTDLSTNTLSAGEGIGAFLTAHTQMRALSDGSGRMGLPVITPRPADPAEGEPFLVVAPVLSEFYFSIAPYPNSRVPKGTTCAAGSHPTDPNSIYPAPKDAPSKPDWSGCYIHPFLLDEAQQTPFGVDARLFGWYETWNPYNLPLIADGGHLQLRLRKLPKIRLIYWINTKRGYLADFDRYTVQNFPNWRRNTWHNPEGKSEWLSLNESDGKKNIGSSNGDYVGIHLLNRVTKGAPSSVYEPGDMNYWFGFKGQRYNGEIINSGLEFLAGGGAAKEAAEEAVRNRVYSYFLHVEAGSAIQWPAIQAKAPWYPSTPPESSAFGGKWEWTVPSHNQGVYTAMTVEVEPSTVEMELWWVPNEREISPTLTGSNLVGDLTKAVRLQSMRMPAFKLEETEPVPPDDRLLVKEYEMQNLEPRMSYHFARKDTSHSVMDGEHNLNEWLTSTLSVDPRSMTQPSNADAFTFGDKSEADPRKAYVEITKLAGITSYLNTVPEINTANQLLDRPSGKFGTGGVIAGADLKDYLYQRNSLVVNEEGTETNGPKHLSQKVPLFEIPTTIPVSLGTLQHLPLNGRRANAIGNSWGRNAGVNNASVNTIFDDYYLSGLPWTLSSMQAVNPLTTLTNSHLLPLWTTQDKAPPNDKTLLSHFLVRGAFNINSTSKEAWKAALSGIWVDQWEFANQNVADSTTDMTKPTGDLSSLRRAFFRFAHTGQDSFIAPENGDPQTEQFPTKYYRRGLRRLTTEQIDILAGLIVKKIKEHKKPFASMDDFLSSRVTGQEMSVIEYALTPPEKSEDAGAYGNTPINKWTAAEVGADPKTGATEGVIDDGAPAAITQADILTALAPVLQARSDTFKIVAYGDVRGADGQTEASALCEMTVQRYPNPVGETDTADTRANPGAMGRQFKIIALKWIKEI